MSNLLPKRERLPRKWVALLGAGAVAVAALTACDEKKVVATPDTGVSIIVPKNGELGQIIVDICPKVSTQAIYTNGISTIKKANNLSSDQLEEHQSILIPRNICFFTDNSAYPTKDSNPINNPSDLPKKYRRGAEVYAVE